MTLGRRTALNASSARPQYRTAPGPGRDAAAAKSGDPRPPSYKPLRRQPLQPDFSPIPNLQEFIASRDELFRYQVVADEDVSSEVGHMYRYAIPYPVLPGRSDAEVKEAADYFRCHPDDYRESRRGAGVRLERVYVQKTPMGAVVVAYIEAEKPFVETFRALLDLSLEVNRYFADFIHRVHEVDLSRAATAPPPETIVEWSDPNATTRQRGLAFTVPGIPGQEEYGKAFARTTAGDCHGWIAAAPAARRRSASSACSSA